MNRGLTRAVALAALLAAVPTVDGRAQYARYLYPRGYGNYGWNGWGGGQTVQGDVARGLGVYAAGAGAYNRETAVANAVNANTVMRWNQYWYEAQRTANRAERERLARRQYGTTQAQEKIYSRLRDNPEPRDIENGDALNVALEEVNDPRVYSKALAEGKVTLGGELIRDIPFQYAAAAVTASVHRLTSEPPPSALMTPEFATVRAELRSLRDTIRKQLSETGTPDPATIDKALKLVTDAEARIDSTLPANGRDRVEADRYLKALHGLLAMAKTPALDVLLSGVEKRGDATLADLLTFMNAFNLRFGAASTPRQKEVYTTLYPKLVALREKVAPAREQAASPQPKGTEARDFFSGMSYRDLREKAPPPPPRPAERP